MRKGRFTGEQIIGMIRRLGCRLPRFAASMD